MNSIMSLVENLSAIRFQLDEYQSRIANEKLKIEGIINRVQYSLGNSQNTNDVIRLLAEATNRLVDAEEHVFFAKGKMEKYISNCKK